MDKKTFSLEIGLLGAMILDPTCIPIVRDIVQPGDFEIRAHRRLCSEIFRKHVANETITVERLIAGDMAVFSDTIGGATYITAVIKRACEPHEVRIYALELVRPSG